MSAYMPKVLYDNEISKVLDDIKYSYGILTRKGIIYGLIVIDQDAKIIAVDSRKILYGYNLKQDRFFQFIFESYDSFWISTRKSSGIGTL